MIDASTRELPAPGVYPGVPAAHYHGRGWSKAASSSKLRTLAERTPSHIPVSDGQEATAAMVFGDMVHTLALQEHLFADLYVERPEGNANSNAFKRALSRIQAEKPWARIVKAEDFDRAHKAVEVLKNHELAGPTFFGEGRSEVSLVWIDPATGAVCKARLDSFDPDIGVSDLKVTSDTSEHAISNKVASFRYDLQAGFYIVGASACELDVIPEFAFWFIEDQEPFDIRFMRVPGRVLTAAEAQIDELLPIWKSCQDTGRWPRRPAQMEELPIPYNVRLEVERLAPAPETYAGAF